MARKSGSVRNNYNNNNISSSNFDEIKYRNELK